FLRTTTLLSLCHVYSFIFYVIPCLYIRSLSVMLSRISFHVLYGRSFKTLCLLKYALMKRHDYDITVFFTKRGVAIMVSETGFETVGSKDLTCEDWNALQTLLPWIRAEIHEEFRTSFGPSNSGGNPPPVIIHTWLERFNKQKPCSFEKATASVDAENWISHMEKILDVMGSAGTEEEQEKNFQWGLRRSTLNHLMCMPFTDVAQVA
nr:hypothetical protein [Tanacetum cinerariifolium]